MFGTKIGFPENNEVKIWLWNNTHNEMQGFFYLKHLYFKFLKLIFFILCQCVIFFQSS